MQQSGNDRPHPDATQDHAAQDHAARDAATLSSRDRIAVVNAIGALVGKADTPDLHRQQAHDILQSLSSDAVVDVRAALARAIAEYPLLPPKLAETLASDVADVAVPMLRHSAALSDAFLISLIDASLDDPDKHDVQSTIAAREGVSAPVSTKLLSDGHAVAVETVLGNKSATIVDEGFEALFSRSDLDANMLWLAAARDDLPGKSVETCHRLVLTDVFERQLCRDVRQKLIETYSLPPSMADDIVKAAQEDALAQATDTQSSAAQLVPLATHLKTHGDITASLMLRMICHGSLGFAIAAFQVLTGKKEKDVHAAFKGAGSDALNELYIESGLKPYFRFAIVTAAKRMTASPQHAAKTVELIIRDIVKFYRGIAPGSLDQVLSNLSHEADRWQE